MGALSSVREHEELADTAPASASATRLELTHYRGEVVHFFEDSTVSRTGGWALFFFSVVTGWLAAQSRTSCKLPTFQHSNIGADASASCQASHNNGS